MHSRTYKHLDCFQIQVTRLSLASKDAGEQWVYFARDFLLDGVGRFFP